MLPRELRVTRCKAPHKTARAMEARKSRAAAPTDRKKGGKPVKDKKSKKEADGKYVPKVTPEAQTLAGRASKLLGRSGAAQLVGKPAGGKDKRKPRDRKSGDKEKRGTEAATAADGKGIRAPEEFVFEGRRASAKDGKPKDLKFKHRSKGKNKVHKKKKKAGKGGK
ncbi:hypothetical protein VTK26DRAFT_6741 [Humicola hyalothermophila]